MTTALILPLPQSPEYRVFNVAARRCPQDPGRYRWAVREADGLLVAQAAMSFATEAEAFRAGNAVARAIRRKAS
jgi:hypothetical protein